ncbi:MULTISPECIES: hypothetical protein [Clostridium]|uniref:hypothetical protein n=1 Tax=Clostridium TaxID=1485 RepID=UPI000824343D|nr:MULTISPECIES: hypothetical protein [Clostridium]PJI07935.1 hypothetical protein CUB90_08665 [Clostridium sp. CT7]
MKKILNNFMVIILAVSISIGIIVLKIGFLDIAKFLIYIILSVATCIIVQELSYVLIGKMYGIISRVICMGPFAFFKEDGKIKVKFKMVGYPGFFGNIEGIHMPSVSSKEDFQRVKKNLAKVFFSGFFGDLIICVVCMILIFTIAINKPGIKEFLIITIVMAEIMAFVSVAWGNVKNAVNMKKSPEGRIIDNILFLAIYYDGIKEVHRFSYLIEKYIELDKNLKCVDCEDSIMIDKMNYSLEVLYLYLGGVINEMPANSKKFIKYVVSRKDEFMKRPKLTRSVLNIVYRYILYLALVDKNKEKALELYNYFKKFLANKNNKSENYTKIFLEHILDIKDNYDYLINMNNLVEAKGGMWFGKVVHEMDLHMINLKNS